MSSINTWHVLDAWLTGLCHQVRQLLKLAEHSKGKKEAAKAIMEALEKLPASKSLREKVGRGGGEVTMEKLREILIRGIPDVPGQLLDRRIEGKGTVSPIIYGKFKLIYKAME